MSLTKKPYEISLWEDRLTLVDSNFDEYDGLVPEGTSIVGQYYKEIKLCVIGAHDLNSPIRAFNPKLNRKIDGSKTLSFSIYSRYYDEESDLEIVNPYIQYLTNERKVKLKYQEGNQTKWADFIIKQITESSEQNLYSYIAEDYFVNELSKSGLNLVFDIETKNNQGNINELGERILAGTDWQIAQDTQLIQQTQEEALYKIVLRTGITATNVLTKETKTIPAGQVIYTFYSCIANKEENFFQFLYNEDGQYELDENRVIINGNEYYFSFSSPQDLNWPYFAEVSEYTSDFRGTRHVRTQMMEYDETLEKYVNLYEKDGQIYKGYPEVQYIVPDLIRSYITSNTTFSGWGQRDFGKLEKTSVPSYRDIKDYRLVRLPTLKYVQTPGNFLFNSGLRDNSYYLDDIIQGEEHRFRIKCGRLSSSKDSLVYENLSYKIECRTFKLNPDGTYADRDASDIVLFEATIGGNVTERDSEDYAFGDMPALVSVTKQQLKEKEFGTFITILNGSSEEYHLVDAQLFKKRFDANGKLAYPGGKTVTQENGSYKVNTDFQEKIETTYYYYPFAEYKTPEEIEYVYIGEKSEDFLPKYDETYTKIRSITASGTNRFNLLQQLSETFECWCKIDVKHKENGEVMLGKDLGDTLVVDGNNSSNGNINSDVTSDTGSTYGKTALTFEEAYRPQKFISFHETIGQVNNVDFIAGINLKSISRNLTTNDFVTKLIVKNNNNEFAPSGSCSIVRATENPIGENFLINFDYYIKMGLLNYDNFYNDLYSMSEGRGWLGYYTRLKALNNEILSITEDYLVIAGKVSAYESNYQVALELYEATAKELRDSEDLFKNKTTFTFDEIDADNSWLKEEEIIALGETILELRNRSKRYFEDLEQAEFRRTSLNEKLKELSTATQELNEQKRELNSEFEKKYSRFIQEAPWSSDDYMDDNLYYLDAESTLHNSAQPKVTYTISVIDLSPLEGFENYTFQLGDIAHAQDPEFFGYVHSFVNGKQIKTPYREKVIVTEIDTEFDDPTKDTIKVQNFRSQFEDLFQRMAASTQKVEFHSGSYEKAANAIETNGQVSTESLRDAFTNNSYVLQNANNQSVSWAESGIVAKNLNAPNEIVRIVGGGIFVTEDGGKTWTTGMTGKGINAKTITTGALNTGLITIMDDSQPAFRWDNSGISAYKKEENGVYNNNTFVRYDQFGLYGIRESSRSPKSLNEVWDQASFALTWKGFKLKNGTEKGSIEISTDEDFIVRDDSGNPVVHIGKIIENNQYVYGLTIGNNDKVFQATPNGLTVAGWKAEEGAFVGEYVDEQGNKKVVGLYSNPNLSNGHFITAGRDGSPVFSVDYSGFVKATSGEIGGWYLAENAFYIPYENPSEENKYNLYLGPGAGAQLALNEGSGVAIIDSLIFKVGEKFGVTNSGELYAFSGRIGGWEIDDNSLSSGGGDYYFGTTVNTKGYVLQIGNNFGVKRDGSLVTTGAVLAGLNAETGTVGGWNITENSIFTTGIALLAHTDSSSGEYVIKTSEVSKIETVVHKEEIKMEIEIGPDSIEKETVDGLVSYKFQQEINFNEKTEGWYTNHKSPITTSFVFSNIKCTGWKYGELSGDITVLSLKPLNVTLSEDQSDSNLMVMMDVLVNFKESVDDYSYLQISATLSAECSTTLETKDTAPGFCVKTDGEASLSRGSIGDWYISNQSVRSPLLYNATAKEWERVDITPHGINYYVFANSNNTNPDMSLSKTWKQLLS